MALLCPSVAELAALFGAEPYLRGTSLPYDTVEANRQHLTGLLVRYSNAELVEIVKAFPGLCAPLLLVKFLELADDARMVATKHDVFLQDCMYLGFGGDPETELDRMKSEGKLYTRVCNSVWGKFSIAYRCSTCGLSSASSLCVECFRAGDHEGHDYCIYKSSFGGCCDCGNPEAWKTEGNCKHHRGYDPTENPLEVLEGDTFMGDGKAFSVMLHTAFILTLRSLIRDAMKTGLEEPEEPWDHLLGSFSGVSVPWLEKLSGMGDSIRRLAGRELRQVWLTGPVPQLVKLPPPEEDEPLTASIARVRAASEIAETKKISPKKKLSLLYGLGAMYSTATCDQLINLYLQLLCDGEFKHEFMLIFLHFYPSLADHMLTLTEDQPKREMDDFINRVTAQLWNIHDSVSEMSHNETDLIGLLMGTLFSVLVKAVPEGKTHVSCANKITTNDLYWSFTTDLSTVLSYKPIYEYVVRSRRDLLQTWLQISALCVDLSPIKRERFAHVQYEQNEWRVSFALEISLARYFQPFFSGFSQLIADLGEEHGIGSGRQLAHIRDRVGLVVSQLNDMFTMLSMEQDLVSTVQANGDEMLMTQYDIQMRPVTMHINLHRILAGFMLQAIDVTDLETIISKESLSPHFIAFLLEHPLRIHALHAQVQAGMWVRNGNSLLSQVILYRKNQCCYDDGFDYDVAMMQMTAILGGADHFVAVAQNRFGLVKHITAELENMGTKDRTTLLFEFLAFLIHISSHLFRGCLSNEEQMVREIVHRLVWEDQTFSKLSSTICQRLTQDPQFAQLLNKVAWHQTANDFEEGRYRLRREYWAYYDQYYPRFFPRERQLAQDRYKSFLASQSMLKEKGTLPQPKLSPIKPQLRRIVLLLSCRSTMEIIHAILKHRVRRNDAFAEHVVNAALHLLYLGLQMTPADENDALSSSSGGSFDEAAFDSNLQLPYGSTNESILDLLAVLYQRCEDMTLPFVRALLVKASSRSATSSLLIRSLLPDLLDGSDQSKRGDESALRKSRIREENRQRQQEIMKKFKAAQSNFLHNTADDPACEDVEQEDSSNCLTCVLCRDSCSIEHLNSSSRVMGHMGLVQRSRLMTVTHEHESATCSRLNLLTVSINDFSGEQCEEEDSSAAASPSVERGQEVPLDVSMASQQDTIINRDEMIEDPNEETTNAAPTIEELIRDPYSEESKDIRFCGHHVHSDCLFRYFATLCTKHEARQDFEGRRIVALPDGEFLCPFCRRLCNCLVPAVGNFRQKYTASAMAREETLLRAPEPITVEQWLPCLKIPPCEAQVEAMDISDSSALLSQSPPGTVTSLDSEQSEREEDRSNAPSEAMLVPPSSPVPPPPGEGALPQEALRSNLEMLLVRFATVKEPLYPIQSHAKLDPPAIGHLFWEVLTTRIVALEQRARHSDDPFFFYVDGQKPEISQNALLISAWEAYQELSPRANDFRSRGHERLIELVLGRGDGSLLERRLSSVLVACVLSSEAVVSDLMFGGLLRILVAAHMVQSVSSLLAEAAGVAPQPAAALVVLQRLAAGEAITHSIGGTQVLLAPDLHVRMAPFLRQAAILFTTVAVQAGIADCVDAVTMADTDDDHHALCAFLQLPRNLLEVLSLEVLQLAHAWVGSGRCLSTVYAPKPFTFTPLPDLFQEAYQHLATQVCRVCNDVTVEPGICLLCGAFICGGTKHLDLPMFNLKSSLNSFVQHAAKCCAGIGVFLMLKLCTVLLFRGKRISVWNSVYLDEHGEEDLELRRGKALFLNKSRLRQLLGLVLSQAIDHDTRVLDKTKQLVRV